MERWSTAVFELHPRGDFIPVRIGGLIKLRKRLEGFHSSRLNF